jgi:osmoprotectant transport system permease protein
VVVASAAFTEQYTLSHAIAAKLEGAGFRPERREGMNYGVQQLALQQGEVDCLVAYTGDVWSLLMKRKYVADRATTLAESTRYLEEEFGVVCLGQLGFQNNYAVAVAGKRASADGLTTIADLVAHVHSHPGRRLRVAGDTGVFHQTEWRRLKENYGLRDEEVETVEMDPSLMYAAAADGQVDAAIAFSSDGRIGAFGLKLLEDPQLAFPTYDALLLLSRSAYAKPGVVDALRPLVGAIDQERMREANRRVDVGKESPKRAAEWLLRPDR